MLTKNGKLCLVNATSKSYKLLTGEMGNVQGSNIRNAVIKCGTGTTPPSVDDYCLETPIDSLTQVSTSYTMNNYYEDNFLETITTTLQNNTSEDITVNEIGAVGSTGATSALIARDVLSTPVVITAGSQKTFTIQIG